MKTFLEKEEKDSGLHSAFFIWDGLNLEQMLLGAAKKAITDSVKYANERKQFGVLISTFGALNIKWQNRLSVFLLQNQQFTG